ncbi:hypothetical protein [Limibacterium fermenti]
MDKIILDVKPGMTDKWNRAFHRMKQEAAEAVERALPTMLLKEDK